jgi:hypothetical protein
MHVATLVKADRRDHDGDRWRQNPFEFIELGSVGGHSDGRGVPGTLEQEGAGAAAAHTGRCAGAHPAAEQEALTVIGPGNYVSLSECIADENLGRVLDGCNVVAPMDKERDPASRKLPRESTPESPCKALC